MQKFQETYDILSEVDINFKTIHLVMQNKWEEGLGKDRNGCLILSRFVWVVVIEDFGFCFETEISRTKTKKFQQNYKINITVP